MGGGEGGGALAEGVGVDGVGFEEEVEDLGGLVPGLALEVDEAEVVEHADEDHALGGGDEIAEVDFFFDVFADFALLVDVEVVGVVFFL